MTFVKSVSCVSLRCARCVQRGPTVIGVMGVVTNHGALRPRKNSAMPSYLHEKVQFVGKLTMIEDHSSGHACLWMACILHHAVFVFFACHTPLGNVFLSVPGLDCNAARFLHWTVGSMCGARNC